MSSKSANYCYPTRTKNVGFVLLCEVSERYFKRIKRLNCGSELFGVLFLVVVAFFSVGRYAECLTFSYCASRGFPHK